MSNDNNQSGGNDGNIGGSGNPAQESGTGGGQPEPSKYPSGTDNWNDGTKTGEEPTTRSTKG
jgi:hypothetical protein